MQCIPIVCSSCPDCMERTQNHVYLLGCLLKDVSRRRPLAFASFCVKRLAVALRMWSTRSVGPGVCLKFGRMFRCSCFVPQVFLSRAGSAHDGSPFCNSAAQVRHTGSRDSSAKCISSTNNIQG